MLEKTAKKNPQRKDGKNGPWGKPGRIEFLKKLWVSEADSKSCGCVIEEFALCRVCREKKLVVGRFRTRAATTPRWFNVAIREGGEPDQKSQAALTLVTS